MAAFVILFVAVRTLMILNGESFDLIDGMIAPVIIGVLLVFMFVYAIPRRARGIFREHVGVREPTELILSENGPEFRQPSGDYHPDWSTFIRWRECSGHLLLSVNRAMMIPLPLAQIGEERAAFIRSRLVASGLPRPGKRRK